MNAMHVYVCIGVLPGIKASELSMSTVHSDRHVDIVCVLIQDYLVFCIYPNASRLLCGLR